MNWNDRIRTAFHASSRVPDDDVIEELAQHARAMFEAARAEGCSPEEAARRVDVQVELWRAEADVLHQRSTRAVTVEPPSADVTSWWTGLLHDSRYAARLLRRQPRFALLVVFTMTLGIAATTTLFSVTYGVLMKPLPWPNGDRLVLLKETRGGMPPRFGAITNAAYRAWREDASTIDAVGAWTQQQMTLSGASDAERIRVTAATASLLRALGVGPLIGSLFEEKDETGAPVVILSESMWRRRFAGDPAALGRAIELDGKPHTIVGVIADRYTYPDSTSIAWVPFHVVPADGNRLSLFSAVAALRPGATAAQASAEATGRGRFAPDTGMTTTAIFGSRGPIEIAATPLRDALTSEVRRPLMLLLAAVLLLLATAIANVASLQLARATTRHREMAIRAALGAGGGRVVRQLLAESVLLALLGGAAGVTAAALLHRVLPALLPASFPRADSVAVDVAVLLFALCASVVAGVAFGVLPALRLRRVNLVESLSEDAAGSVGASRRSRTAQLRMAIMAGQVAIACILLLGASLLGRSFMALLAADRGYDPAGVLTARLTFSSADTPERRHAIVATILERASQLPGVTAAGFTSEMPLTPGGSSSGFSMPSRTGEEGTVNVQASPRIVSPGAFPALGMRLASGRSFDDRDTETSMPVVIVNQAFARTYLGEAAIGATLPMAYASRDGETPPATVVGVVEDVRYVTERDVTQPEMFYSYRQMERRLVVPTVTLLVRTAGDPRPLAAALRAVVRDTDDRLAADAVATLRDRLVRTLAQPRLYAIVLGGLAAFALAIAAVGLFGVLSYSVAQRSREIAVRAALGATRMDIARLVLGQGLVVTAIGLCAGLLASVWLSDVVSAQLYGVTAQDTLTFVGVPLLLLLVSGLACVLPARRASRLDPLRVLRGN